MMAAERRRFGAGVEPLQRRKEWRIALGEFDHYA
jgi:hypothetical protein